MRYSFPALLLLLFVFSSCTNESGSTAKTQSPDLKKDLLGTWEAVSIHVDVVTPEGEEDEDPYQFVIEENEWETKIGTEPILSYYEADNNSFRWVYRLAGTEDPMSTTRGKWFIHGDTLRIVTESDTYDYLVTLKDGLATFKNMQDWDGDGAVDDAYTGVHRKISNYTR